MKQIKMKNGVLTRNIDWFVYRANASSSIAVINELLVEMKNKLIELGFDVAKRDGYVYHSKSNLLIIAISLKNEEYKQAVKLLSLDISAME